jgi:uncharacterized protein (TIGR00304 family)
MQFSALLLGWGWILIFIGIILVCLYAISATRESDFEGTDTQTKSKGIIFLGPIPIVWGLGWKGWGIACVTAFILIILWIFFV